MMKSFDYQLDKDTYEVFPSDVCSDKYVVFHGTSSYHSPEIESKGLIRGTAPFDISAGKALVELLRNPQIASLVDPNPANQLDDYIKHMTAGNPFRLSFAFLSSTCVSFASGSSKGGQIMGHVRKAKEDLKKTITDAPHLEALIKPIVKELFTLEDKIFQAEGVIYAVKLPANLMGVSSMGGPIHVENDIPVESIVGKVIISKDLNDSQLSREMITQRSRAKWLSPTGLGMMIQQKTFANRQMDDLS